MKRTMESLENAVEMRSHLNKVVDDFLNGNGDYINIEITINGKKFYVEDTPEEVGWVGDLFDKLIKNRYEDLGEVIL